MNTAGAVFVETDLVGDFFVGDVTLEGDGFGHFEAVYDAKHRCVVVLPWLLVHFSPILEALEAADPTCYLLNSIKIAQDQIVKK